MIEDILEQIDNREQSEQMILSDFDTLLSQITDDNMEKFVSIMVNSDINAINFNYFD